MPTRFPGADVDIDVGGVEVDVEVEAATKEVAEVDSEDVLNVDIMADV